MQNFSCDTYEIQLELLVLQLNSQTQLSHGRPRVIVHVRTLHKRCVPDVTITFTVSSTTM